MRPLEEADLLALLRRALEDPRGLPGTPYEEEALRVLAQAAGGDARFALNTLELAASFGRVDLKSVREALGAERFGMDREGDRFYDLVSALHKSLRGSHVDAALYYLARLLQGGADPRYLARRLIRVAVEDVGLADPLALRLAVAAKEAYEALGSPEGELALVEAAVYLALAPKSNSLYAAWKKAQEAAKAHPEAEVPLNLRNAPTGLARALGHGEGYAYYHEDKEEASPRGTSPRAWKASPSLRPRGRGGRSGCGKGLRRFGSGSKPPGGGEAEEDPAHPRRAQGPHLRHPAPAVDPRGKLVGQPPLPSQDPEEVKPGREVVASPAQDDPPVQDHGHPQLQSATSPRAGGRVRPASRATPGARPTLTPPRRPHWRERLYSRVPSPSAWAR